MLCHTVYLKNDHNHISSSTYSSNALPYATKYWSLFSSFCSCLDNDNAIEVTLHDLRGKVKNVICLLPGLVFLRVLTLAAQPPFCEETQATGQDRGRFISPQNQLMSQPTAVINSHMSEPLVESSPGLCALPDHAGKS